MTFPGNVLWAEKGGRKKHWIFLIRTDWPVGFQCVAFDTQTHKSPLQHRD